MAKSDCSRNTSDTPVFLLLGLQVIPEMNPFLFLMFLMVYLLTASGNILIVVTVRLEAKLHSPMYFFLGNLALLDVWSTSNVVPTLLGGLLTHIHLISFHCCLIQYFFFGWMATTECFLLTVMAYDRYVAICYPLHYQTLMDQRCCLQLAASAWVGGLFSALTADSLMSTVQFYGQGLIDHFFCDFEPLLKAACSDTSQIKTITFYVSSSVIAAPFVFIIISYSYIMATVLGIPSAKGRKKAFSTCSSHLVVVSTYFGILIIMYMVPSAGHSLNANKALSLLYTVATPMINPIVYALKNKALMGALKEYRWKKSRLLHV
ncbi:olfactory receptor 1M1-like [Pleurodeles waltl]|uniref:olfactory receptor 1M1-like n=1 Tax=Pleurodeles waltl TaxID=8319 RepID=UPI00370980D8